MHVTTFEDLAEPPKAHSHRGSWDFDPNPPPSMIVDLDRTELGVTPVSYNAVCGMELDEEEFVLEAGLDDEYELEAGEDWRVAYWLVSTVHPDLSRMMPVGLRVASGDERN